MFYAQGVSEMFLDWPHVTLNRYITLCHISELVLCHYTGTFVSCEIHG